MEFVPRALTMFCLLAVYLLLIIQPVTCRFYRNIPISRLPQRTVQIDVNAPIPTAQVEVFEDGDNVVPLNRAMERGQLDASGHLMLLRPDYTFRRVATIFRNLFDKRVSSVSERRRRTELADAFLRRQLRDSLLQ